MQTIKCPNCSKEYSVALYDFDFIYCTNCKTYFDKKTGNKINKKATLRNRFNPYTGHFIYPAFFK